MTTKQEALDALDEVRVWVEDQAPWGHIDKKMNVVRSLINSVPEWRPIEEYDFAKGGRVYVYTDEMCQGVAYYDGHDKGWRWDSGYPLWRDGGKPTHFMVLDFPQPPKETQ